MREIAATLLNSDDERLVTHFQPGYWISGEGG